MLRVPEYTAQSSTSWDVERTLSPRDVAVGWSSRVVSVAIKVSKTDPFRIGATIKVCERGSQLCPFSALVRYLQIRGASEGHLFIFGSGEFLTRNHVAAVLHRFAPGHDLNTHSLRQGGATALAQMGVPTYVIHYMGSVVVRCDHGILVGACAYVCYRCGCTVWRDARVRCDVVIRVITESTHVYV